MTTPAASFYEEDGMIPAGVPSKWTLVAQAVTGGFQARLIWHDEVAPLWKGDTVHPDAEAALSEAMDESAKQIDVYCTMMEQ